MAPPGNRLYYGDNLDVLRKHIANDSVDLIYLDPPFNSNRSYNVLFKSHAGDDSQAQIEAFDDTWHWSQQAEKQFQALIAGGAPISVADAIAAMRQLLGTSDVLAYLVMMTARLVELHRVLKPTGSLYLHCDPTASHYLKIILDAVFGPEQFLNEITWRRTFTVKGNAGQGARHFGRNTDSILLYSKTDVSTFNTQYLEYSEEYIRTKFSQIEPETGRRFQTVSMAGPGGAAKGNPFYEVLGVSRFWRFSEVEMQRLISDGRVYQGRPGDVPRQKYYLDEAKGVQVQALWADIDAINSQASERLGYPTQKPLALLERIILASSNPGDVVLDPFCGCGTTIDAAQKLERRWIGIDISYLSVDLITKRLRNTYTDAIVDTFKVEGIPVDVAGAEALFSANPFDFERWAVSLVDGTPNERNKQVGDKGIDGRIRFFADKDKTGTCLVSVKGGRAVAPTAMRDLVGVLDQERADMGLMIVMAPITRGMKEVADKSGIYEHPISGTKYPRVQIVNVADLLAHKRPALPPVILPYVKAKQYGGEQLTFG